MFVGSITGNVGKDAELRYLADGKPVVGFSVASSRKTKAGEETTWVNISFFGTRAEKIATYITKGKQVSVYGEVRNRPYEKDGATKYSLEIEANNVQLLGSPKDSTTSSTESDSAAYAGAVSVSSATDPF